jgi:hypothetical protein
MWRHAPHSTPVQGVEWGGRWAACTPFHSCARSGMGWKMGRHAPHSTPVQGVEWGGRWAACTLFHSCAKSGMGWKVGPLADGRETLAQAPAATKASPRGVKRPW